MAYEFECLMPCGVKPCFRLRMRVAHQVEVDPYLSLCRGYANIKFKIITEILRPKNATKKISSF